MSISTKARIVKIGNSRGIRIPKLLLDQAELGDEVELEVAEGQVVIRAVRNPRSAWDEQFVRMAELGDDRLLDAETAGLTGWDTDEWEW